MKFAKCVMTTCILFITVSCDMQGPDPDFEKGAGLSGHTLLVIVWR